MCVRRVNTHGLTIRVNNLGGVLKALGDLPGAKAAYARALKILQKLLGDDHQNTRLVRGNFDSLSP